MRHRPPVAVAQLDGAPGSRGSTGSASHEQFQPPERGEQLALLVVEVVEQPVAEHRDRGLHPGRTSADDGHTSVVIMPVTCGNGDSPRSGRVTTSAPQVQICGVAPTCAADQ
jgi:hypothetical protein